MLSTNDTAPAINLPATDDATFDLAEIWGPAVVFFYPKDDTPGCTNEALDFTRLKSDFDALGVKVVGISPDPVAKHQKFRTKNGLDVILASDEEKSVLESYGVWVEKSMYGRKYMGVERSTFLIDGNGKIAEIWRKVKVKGHANAVLEAARTLQGAETKY